MHPPRYAPAALFVFWLALYLLTASGRIAPGDEETMFRVADSLATRGALDVARETVAVAPLDTPVAGGPAILPVVSTGLTAEIQTSFAVRGVDGRSYAWYGPGQSLAALPLWWIGRALAWAVPSLGAPYAERFAASAVTALATALAAWLVADAGLALGYRPRTALALSAAYGLTTMAWPYAKSWFSEPAVTASLLLSFEAGVRARASGVQASGAQAGDAQAGGARRGAWAWLGGAALGAAVLFRPTALLWLPALGFLAVWPAQAREALTARGLRLMGLGVPIALALVATGAYNAARFGSPFNFGYPPEAQIVWDTPVIAGLFGLLATPGKGLFLYNPALLAGVGGLLLWLAAPPGARLRRVEGLAVLAATVLVLLYFAPYHYWSGGWNWGPRFLLPLVPWLLLPAGALLEAATTALVPAVWTGLCALGLLINLPAVLVDHSRYLIGAAEHDPEFYGHSIWDPAYSPVVRQWPMVGEVWTLWNTQRPALARGALRYAADVPGVVQREEFLRWNTPDFWQAHWALLGLPLWLAGGLSLVCLVVMAGAAYRVWQHSRDSRLSGKGG